MQYSVQRDQKFSTFVSLTIMKMSFDLEIGKLLLKAGVKLMCRNQTRASLLKIGKVPVFMRSILFLIT